MRAGLRQRDELPGVRLVVTLPEGREVVHEIDRPEITVGRDPKNDIVIPDPLVSELHAKLVLAEDGTLRLVDLGSANKTRLNGLEVSEAILRYGDELQFARVKCRLFATEAPERAEAPVVPVGESSAPVPEEGFPRVGRSGRFKLYLVLGLLVLFSLLSALAARVVFG